MFFLQTLGVLSGVPLGRELSLLPSSEGELFEVDSPKRSKNEDKF